MVLLYRHTDVVMILGIPTRMQQVLEQRRSQAEEDRAILVHIVPIYMIDINM